MQPFESSSRLKGERIQGHMLGLERQRTLQSGPPEGRRLVGETEHKVKADIREPGVPGGVKGLFCIIGRMRSVKRSQESVVERLDPDAKSIETGGPHREELFRVR